VKSNSGVAVTCVTRQVLAAASGDHVVDAADPLYVMKTLLRARTGSSHAARGARRPRPRDGEAAR